MGELFVEGPEAGAALAAALVTNPPALAVGRAHYSMIVRAGRRDHRRPDRLPAGRRAVPRRRERRQRPGRERHAGRAADRGSRRSSTTARWRRRSSPSRARGRWRSSRPLTDVDLDALRYYAIAEGDRGRASRRSSPAPATRARTASRSSSTRRGPASSGTRSWPAGRTHGLAPIGLGARDTLRLEAGMPLYGNELDRDDEPVRGRPRAGRQARQAGRLRGPGGAREGRARGRHHAGSSGS